MSSPLLKKAQLYLFYKSEATKGKDKKIPAFCRDLYSRIIAEKFTKQTR